jgi:hypothetical protein
MEEHDIMQCRHVLLVVARQRGSLAPCLKYGRITPQSEALGEGQFSGGFGCGKRRDE